MNNGLVSIVIPCYRSENSLPELVERLLLVGVDQGREFEIILVDDRSPDGTWETLKVLKVKYGKPLKIIRLLRNAGQHNALLCGMQHASGEVVITMDDDLQNPPEDVPKLLAGIADGYDLVVGSYEQKKHSAFRNLGGNLVDCLLRRIFHLPSDFQLTSFRAVRREVVENVCRMGGVFPYITAMILSHTGSQVNVPVRHEPRKYGTSNYGLRRSLSLAANLLFNYSSYPIYFIAMLCGFAFLLSFGFGMYVMIRTFLFGSAVPGWASTVIIVSFLNALTLLSLVIFGLYLSRMNQLISHAKPKFTVKEQQ
jgi:dolichol-phosphate mannosyltransferase/undecaprenyl-phosphate 4-deoxy-4-formamido-L-arabinose transferase